jgi:LAO/AO transport system kinase
MSGAPLSLEHICNKADVAAALSAIEQDFASEAVANLLDKAFERPRGITIGITGPPGAGKSTLINVIIAELRRLGRTVAVLAVDPSSKLSGGALLGDRVRMRADPDDAGVFIRSVAARGRLGGLASLAYPAAVLFRALYDQIIVESVGVGQSETDIETVSDTVVLCIQPASGDALQFMKAGIAEIPDIAVVTKADMGAPASRALADLKGALSLSIRDAGDWEPDCLSISAMERREGTSQFFAALHRHETWLRGENRLASRRRAKARFWLESEIAAQFGKKGLELAEQDFLRAPIEKPFALARRALTEFAWVRKPTAPA